MHILEEYQLRERDMGMRAVMIANMLLREASYGPVDVGSPHADQRREHLMAYVFLLLGQLRLNHYGRKQRAMQRAFGVGEEALTQTTEHLSGIFKRELEWA